MTRFPVSSVFSISFFDDCIFWKVVKYYVFSTRHSRSSKTFISFLEDFILLEIFINFFVMDI